MKLKYFTTMVSILLLWLLGAGAYGATRVPASRLALLSRGINADNIVNNSRLADYTAADLFRLRIMRINNIRIPIDPSYIVVGVPIDGQTALSDAARVALGTDRLSQYVRLFVQGGFAVTLVIQPQKSLYKLSDSASEAIILQGIDLLTRQYANIYTPDQIFFEALNEPHYDTATWNAFAPQIVAAIRANAPNHTIIVPPASWDLVENFASLNLINDMNIIYTMHIYAPAMLTLQGTVNAIPLPNYRFPKPPRAINPTEWSYQRLDQYMHVGIDWAAANNVPLIMNEFGATSVSNRMSRLNWINFVRRTAQQNHIGWAYWSFDGKLFGLRPRGLKWDPNLLALLSS
jgi:endoglucanase